MPEEEFADKRTPAQQVMDKAMPEAEFSQWVKEEAESRRWLAYHTYRSKHSEPGYPDWCLVRGRRIIFAELKREKGKVTDAQDRWLQALSFIENAEVYVWRPSGRPGIERVLE